VQLIAQFMQHCPQATKADAEAFVARAEGNVELAVALYQSNQMDSQASSSKAKPSAAQQGKKPPGNQNYFVGGGKSSGQAVEAPPSQDPLAQPAGSGANSVVQDLFAKARERGAQDGVPETSNPFFTGSGRRLGHLEGPSPAMAPVRRAERAVQITFYANGFQVDDGPLRSLEDPDGKRFLEVIHRGRVPPEISAMYPSTDIAVTLADRGDEDYVPPKYKAFGGQGVRLDGTAGAASASPAQPAAAAPPAPSAAAKGPQPLPTKWEFDPSQEACKVVVQGLANTRSEVQVNPKKHTVLDLFFIAVSLVPGTAAQNVELCTRGIPTGMKVLSDMSQTVDAAQLRNTVVMLRAKKV
jgi:UBX domain-containing protein 1